MNKRLNYIQENFQSLKQYKKIFVVEKSKDEYKITKPKKEGVPIGTKIFKNGKRLELVQWVNLNVGMENITLEYAEINKRHLNDEPTIHKISLDKIHLDLEFKDYKIKSRQGMYMIFHKENEMNYVQEFSMYISINNSCEFNIKTILT